MKGAMLYTTYNPNKSSNGFTLVEVLIGLTILAAAMTAMITMHITVMQGNSFSQHTTVADLLVQENFEEMLFQAGGENGSADIITDFDDTTPLVNLPNWTIGQGANIGSFRELDISGVQLSQRPLSSFFNHFSEAGSTNPEIIDRDGVQYYLARFIEPDKPGPGMTAIASAVRWQERHGGVVTNRQVVCNGIIAAPIP